MELNKQGLNYFIYDNLHNFQEYRYIFEIAYDPDTYFPNMHDQNFLEEERIYDEIRKFLIDYVTNRRPNETK